MVYNDSKSQLSAQCSDFFYKVWITLQVLGALLLSLVFALESLVKGLLPRALLRRDIKGEVALVTGGGSGIGRLVATKLAAKGARVVSWDINAEGNEGTKKVIEGNNGECHVYTVDLCDRNAVYQTASQVKKEVGKVDILVNNAGIVTGKNFLESPDELIQKTFDVNIMSHFWTTKAFLPDMMKDNKGHVVTVASLAGLVGVNQLVDYAASKFATVGFDESLKLELMDQGKDNVYTTLVCPYYISTGMFDGVKSTLLPILTPDYVASEIVDGILMKVHRVVLPPAIKGLLFLRAVLPVRGLKLVYKSLGAGEAMNDFKGRPQEKRYPGV